MKFFLLLLLLTSSLLALETKRVVVLYNSSSAESKYVAKHYAQKRGISEKNLIGLALSAEGAISITEYEKTLKAPLKKALTEKELWSVNEEGNVTNSEIDLIITTYGVPFKTSSTLLPPGKDAEGNPLPERARPHNNADGASIDAELTTLAYPPYDLTQPLKNPYFKETSPFNANTYKCFLVGRIDGPSAETCIRMINDAVETEARGLYGFCYLDKAFKGGGYAEGDKWIDEIGSMNKAPGIPTVLEETKDVYVTNYPMHGAALYYGWYSHSYSGPFRNTEMTFQKGSVIAHIHSYSAANLRSAESHWVGPILERGAAVTLGNVHEPFLNLTTHLDHFHQELLSGKSVIESAWSATPALSWHNVVLGDPLYRPFKNAPNLDGNDLKLLKSLSPIKTKTKFNQLIEQAEKTNSADLHEAIGLTYSTLTAHEKCLYHYKQAEKYADTDEQKVRNILHQIAYLRKYEQKEKALLLIKANLLGYNSKPIGKSLLAMKNILDPPPPPPAGSEGK